MSPAKCPHLTVVDRVKHIAIESLKKLLLLNFGGCPQTNFCSQVFQFFKTLSRVNCCQWDSNYITRRQIFSDKTTFSSCFKTTSQSKTIYRKPRLCEQMLDLAISHTKNCYTNQDFFSLAIFLAFPKHWRSDALGWYSISSWDSAIKRGSQKRNQYHGKSFF